MKSRYRSCSMHDLPRPFGAFFCGLPRAAPAQECRICPKGHARRHAHCYRSHAPPFPRHCATECRPSPVPHAASVRCREKDGLRQWAVSADAACGPQPPSFSDAPRGASALRTVQPGPPAARWTSSQPVCRPTILGGALCQRPARRVWGSGVGMRCGGPHRAGCAGERGPTRGRQPTETQTRAVPMPWGLGRQAPARTLPLPLAARAAGGLRPAPPLEWRALCGAYRGRPPAAGAAWPGPGQGAGGPRGPS